RHGLAHDHRAGGAQHGYYRRIAGRRMPSVQNGAVFGGHVGGIKDILDTHRHAMERTGWFSFTTPSVRRARLSETVVGIEKCPCLDLIIDLSNSCQAGFDYLHRSKDAVVDQP